MNHAAEKKRRGTGRRTPHASSSDPLRQQMSSIVWGIVVHCAQAGILPVTLNQGERCDSARRRRDFLPAPVSLRLQPLYQ